MLDTPSSPCIRNCCLDSNDICLGCFRSIEEILKWGRTSTSNEDKKQILDNIEKRKHRSS
ncbi:MAG: DUF1289 domain-containing protein [Gammaproteobacteria bacterium]|nr:DUF1289 domain-containing protein [Gammaproteobacteria bacterium]